MYWKYLEKNCIFGSDFLLYSANLSIFLSDIVLQNTGKITYIWMISEYWKMSSLICRYILYFKRCIHFYIWKKKESKLTYVSTIYGEKYLHSCWWLSIVYCKIIYILTDKVIQNTS